MNQKRKTILANFSARLKKLRESLGLSKGEMAAYFDTGFNNYSRYENGQIFPNFLGLHDLARKTDISLDWLVCGEGSMYNKKTAAPKTTKTGETAGPASGLETKAVQPEIPGKVFDNETEMLLDYMERVPYLRHEIFIAFYRFFEEHKETMEAASPQVL